MAVSVGSAEPLSCSILPGAVKANPDKCRFHSHSLGDSYMDYIHYGPIIFVEERMTVTVHASVIPRNTRFHSAFRSGKCNCKNIPRDKLGSCKAR